MFSYDEFMAKGKLYFERAVDAPDDDSEQRSLWLLLGLEFVLRAPLARVHPTLLALPGDDSILHAAGVEIPAGKVKSIPMKTVLVRLTKIDPSFGEDRATAAAVLTDLRNNELHSSSAILANTPESAWYPAFLNVLEAVCKHLDVPPGDLLDDRILQAAQQYRETSDRKVQAEVQKLSVTARTIVAGLTEEEIASREARPSPFGGGMKIACPVCAHRAAWILLSDERTTEPRFNDDTQQITYKGVSVAEQLQCNVCGISLGSTAHVIAAGVDRLFVTEYAEDRYEGWEERMTYDDAMAFLAEGEDYQNE